MLLLSPPEPEEEGPSISRLNLCHEEMMQCLRTIKSTFNPRGRLSDKELWTWIPHKPPNLINLVVEYEQSMSVMLKWDDNDVPGWEDLETWIDSASKLHHLRMDYCRRVASISGQDIDDGMTLAKLRGSFEQSPAHAMVARTYGPNWESELDGILRSYGVSSMSLSQLIPLGKCRDLARHRANEVLRKWEMLKSRNADGQLHDFIRRWAMLGRLARSSWLKSRPSVWDVPHQDIEAWAQTTSDQSEPKLKLFLSSLLNVEDLALDEQLPEFLQSRVMVHPQLLRENDGRCIPFGLYSEALPALRCEGRMIFSNATIQDDMYNLEVAVADESNWSALDPCNGLLSLQAQLLVYDFCLSCTSNTLPEPEPVLEENESLTQERTLLDRFTRFDFSSPDKIDLRYIKDLLQTSLNEAHDDLWQLRQDDEFWLQRMRETKGENCTSRLLTVIFGRIDVFTALADVVDKGLAVHGTSTDVPSRLDEDGASDTIVYLEAALLSAQNEMLQSLTSTRRPRVHAHKPLAKLLELLFTNSPIIRVMDLGRLLRVLDRHIRLWSEQGSTVALPSTLIQAINDLTIITFGLNQVCNHYLFMSTIGPEHFKRFDDLDKLWQARSRAWHNVATTTSEMFDVETRQKLDLLWTRNAIPVAERHHQFWTAIDQNIEAAACSHPEYLTVLRTLHQMKPPIPTTADPSRATPPPTYLPLTGPSQTATKKGKKRAVSLLPSPAHPSDPTPPPSRPIDPRPVIPVPMGNKRAWHFWHDLLSPDRAGAHKEFHWHDLVTGMAAIGYAHEATTGSVYRFAYGHKRGGARAAAAVNFHRPHGNVLSARQARRQWRERMLRRVRLELVED